MYNFIPTFFSPVTFVGKDILYLSCAFLPSDFITAHYPRLPYSVLTPTSHLIGTELETSEPNGLESCFCPYGIYTVYLLLYFRYVLPLSDLC